MHVGIIEGCHITFKQKILCLQYDVVVFKCGGESVFMVIVEDAVFRRYQHAFSTYYAVYVAKHYESSFGYYFPDVGNLAV